MAKTQAEKDREKRIAERRENLANLVQTGKLPGSPAAEAPGLRPPPEVVTNVAVQPESPVPVHPAGVWEGTPEITSSPLPLPEITDAQIKNAGREYLATREGQAVLDTRFPSGTAAIYGILEDNAMKTFEAGYLAGAAAAGWKGGEG
jgi:hypothetical protein